MVDSAGNVTTYNYDNMGFLQSVEDPLTNLTTTIYNTAKQVIASQNAVGSLTNGLLLRF